MMVSSAPLKAVIGNRSNFWLHSTDKGFDLTHASDPLNPNPDRAHISLQTTTSLVTIDPNKTALVIIDMQNFFLSEPLGRTRGPGHLAATQLREHAIPWARKADVQVIWVNWGLTTKDIENMPPAIIRAFGFQGLQYESENPPRDPFASKVQSHGEKVLNESRTLENGKDGTIYKGLGMPMGEVEIEHGKKVDAGRMLMRDTWNTDLWPELRKVYDEGTSAQGQHKKDVWVHKNRMSAMWNDDTDLSKYLREQGIRTLLLSGVNTDQCVAGTLSDAYSRGYDCILLEDACGTTSPDYTQQGIVYNTAKCWGFVTNCTELLKAVGKKD